MTAHFFVFSPPKSSPPKPSQKSSPPSKLHLSLPKLSPQAVPVVGD